MASLSEYTLTSKAVSERLGVSASTVMRWANEDRLPSVRVPGGWRRYRPADVEHFARTLEREEAS